MDVSGYTPEQMIHVYKAHGIPQNVIEILTNNGVSGDLILHDVSGVVDEDVVGDYVVDDDDDENNNVDILVVVQWCFW